MKFEEAFDRLENIVSSLEQGDCSLEDSIKLFEEGMGLAKTCADKLGDAEKKIKKLVKTEAGFQLDLLDGADQES